VAVDGDGYAVLPMLIGAAEAVHLPPPDGEEEIAAIVALWPLLLAA
jgi:hypothetical protein